VLVAAVKAYEGQLYGSSGDRTVLRAYEPPPELLPSRVATRTAPSADDSVAAT